MNSFVLVLTDAKVIAYRTNWRGHVDLVDEVQIDGELTSFLQRLFSKHRCYCCRVIIDSSDEEYILDPMPSIQTAKAKQLIALKTSRHFGDDALTAGMLVSGSGGESRSRILCAGVENKNSLLAFMQAIEASAIVIDRVDSLALLLANDCKRKDLRDKVLLVLSSHDSIYWRFSLIQSGMLLMSRCVSIDSAKKWTVLVSELERTQAYAASLVDDQSGIRVYYAGPTINHSRTPARKLVQSISRRYPLYESKCLYESVIVNSSPYYRRPVSYGCKNKQSAYIKYLVSNVALFASLVLLLAVVFNAYLSQQEINHFTVKTQALGLSLSSVEALSLSDPSTSHLNDFALTDLQKLLEYASTGHFFLDAQELQYRLGLVLTEFPSINLVKLSFERAQISEQANTATTILSKNIQMTAAFSPKNSDVTRESVEGFIAALADPEITILEKSGFDIGINNKGELGAKNLNSKPNISEFSLVMVLEQEKGS